MPPTTPTWLWLMEVRANEKRGHGNCRMIPNMMLIFILTPSDKILVTNFRQCVVPPPMCSFELQLASPVNQVTFLCQPQRTNQLAALTSDGQISVYSQGGLFSVFHKDYNHQTEWVKWSSLNPPDVTAGKMRIRVEEDGCCTCAQQNEVWADAHI